MKKLGLFVLVMVVLTMVLVPVAPAADAGAAAILSIVVPGAGEWYNSGFQGSFPWGECIVGKICCFFQLSSIFDAAAGDASTDMRFDFWSAPK